MQGGLSIALSILFSAMPLVIESPSIRVEFNTEVFAVRFIGAPNGPNLIEPLPIRDEDRETGVWLDPGGMVTDLRPGLVSEAALRRGPAEVLEQSKTHLVALSPLAETAPLRLMKELRLLDDRKRILYKVTVLSEGKEPVEVGVRNTQRLPLRSTVRWPRADHDEPQALSGAESIYPAVVKSREYWLLPVPPTTAMEQVVIGAFGREADVALRRGGVLKRKLVTTPTSPKDAPQGVSMLCVLDTASQSYGLAFQGVEAKVTPASPLVMSEIWEIE